MAVDNVVTPVKATARRVTPRLPSTQIPPVVQRSEDPLPNPNAWAKQLAVAAVDVMEGRREIRSIQRWMTPEVRRQIQAAATQRRGRGGSLPAIAMAARTYRVNPDTAEFAVTVWDQERARAVAGRLVRLRERWHLTELEAH